MNEHVYLVLLAVIILMLAIGLLIHTLRFKHFEAWVEEQFRQISKVTVNYNKNFEAIQNFFNQVNGDDAK